MSGSVRKRMRIKLPAGQRKFGMQPSAALTQIFHVGYSLQRRSGRFARSSPDKQHNTNTDETVDDEEEGSDQGGNKAYQPRKAGRFAKNSRDAQADSDGDTMEDERGSEKPERNPKSSRKNQEAKKDGASSRVLFVSQGNILNIHLHSSAAPRRESKRIRQK